MRNDSQHPGYLKKGRIEYIEPTELVSSSTEMPFPYEDYNIYVELEVRRYSRSTFGSPEQSEIYRVGTSDGTLKIIGGPDSKLTTNYTDASLRGIGVKNNTNEALGMESINITYDRNFIPQVDIKFIDVRGLSFFTTEETAYHETKRTGERKDVGSSIMKQIFTLPHADFFLTVKGFYGKSVQFKLIVSNYKVSFNDSTGNFEINVKFIGKPFGIYTDLPLAMISLAPYLENYGKKYWDGHIGSTFRFSDGITSMKTFLEFQKRTLEFLGNIEPEKTESLSIEDSGDVIVSVQNINKTYEFFIQKLKEFFGEGTPFIQFKEAGQCQHDNKIFNNVFILFGNKPEDAQEEINSILSEVNKKNKEDISYIQIMSEARMSARTWTPTNNSNPSIKEELKAALDKNPDFLRKKELIEAAYTFYSVIESYNKSDISRPIDMPDILKYNGIIPNNDYVIYELYANNFLFENFSYLKGNIDKEGNITFDSGKEFANGENSFFDTEIKKIIKKGAKKETKEFYVCYFYDNKVQQKIQDAASEANINIDSYYNKNNDFNVQEVTKLLGFYPSVENIFKMIFAHMDTFVHAFYTILEKIEIECKNKKRTVRSLGLSETSGVKTDFDNTDPDNLVPPFPGIFKQKVFIDKKNNNSASIKDQYVLPGETYSGRYTFDENSYPELDLVNDIYNAALDYEKKLEELQKLSEGGKNAIENYRTTEATLPLNLYSLFTKGGMLNEYFAFTIKYANEAFNEDLYDVLFIIHYIQYRLSSHKTKKILNNVVVEESKYLLDEYFGQCEGVNFVKGFQTDDLEGLKTYIKNKNIEEVLQKLIDNPKGKEWCVANSKSLLGGSKDDPNITWFNYNSDNYFPMYVGHFEELSEAAAGNNIKENLGKRWVEISDKDTLPDTFNVEEGDLVYQIIEQIQDNNFFEVKGENDWLGDNQKNVPTINYPRILLNFGYDLSSAEYSMYKDILFTYKTGFLRSHKTEYYGDTISDLNEVSAELFYKSQMGHLGGVQFNDSSKNNILVVGGIRVDKSDSMKHSTIFGEEIYKALAKNTTLQNSDNNLKYAQAYMFVFSVPCFIKKNPDDQNIPMRPDGTRSLASMLQEGAFYWRQEYMKNYDGIDPILGNNSEYYSPDKDSIFRISTADDSVFDVISKDKKNKYSYLSCKDYLESIPDKRREYMLNLFYDWARKDFIIIKNQLENYSINNQENYFSNNKGEYRNILQGDYVSQINALIAKNTEAIKNSVIYPRTESKFDLVIQPTSSAQEALKRLYFQYYTVFDFSKINKENTIDVEGLKKAYEKYKNVLNDYLYVRAKKWEKDKLNKKNETQTEEIYIDSDFKLSIYLKLKQLYEHHFCNEEKSRWELKNTSSLGKNKDGCDFNNFIFVDQFYNNIGDKILVNPEKFCNYLSASIINNNQDDTRELRNLSVLTLMSELATSIGMSIHSFPMYNSLTKPDQIYEMFKPHPNLDLLDSTGNYFWCIYSSTPSANLKIAESEFKDDSFDIAASAEDFSPSIPESLTTENGYHVPAFGVTFGKQNQSFFKHITVNMDNFRETEYSIESEMAIASTQSDGATGGKLQGQDIYSVFSNYSYACTVESMGNVQIMPGMMFQLNNIPMFKGTYMIMNVEHSITQGDMTTKFKGVRMNRSSLPYVKSPILRLAPQPGSSKGVYASGVVGETNGPSTSTSRPKNIEFRNKGGEFIVLIDNGHGEETPGKRSPDESLREYRYTREIADLLVEALSKEGIKAIRIVPEDNDIGLSERGNRVNAICNDYNNRKNNYIFISIHVNAAGDGDNWLNATGWQVHTTKGVDASDNLARCLYEAAEEVLKGKTIRKYDSSSKDNYDWENNFTVIYKSNCPAVLTENFFQDNHKDVEYLLSDAGKKDIVEVHLRGILKYKAELEKMEVY